MSDALIVALLLQAAIPVRSPQTPPPPVQAPSDDIVVTGLRDLDDPGSAVTHQTLGSGRTAVGARASRDVFQLAQRFADCAVTRDAGNLDRLRRALDGVVNGASQRFWQSRFVQQKATCAQDVGIAQRLGISTVSSAVPDTSYYERGAMFVAALRMFAPGLKLTKAQTGDRAVQARFNAREVPLARFRLPVDRYYFETALCVVRMQPELASRLIQVDDADTIARIEATMVNGAKPCVGNAARVYFDPSQFRFYIADAVYRWAVAAKGVGSLIPAAG